MFKKYNTLSIFTYLIGFFIICCAAPLITGVQAQTTQSNEAKDKAIKCLNSRNGQEQVTTYGFSDDGGNKLGGKLTRFLTGTFSTSAEAVYPIACKKSTTGRKCTTGNSATDKIVLGGLDPKENITEASIDVSFLKPGTRDPESKLTIGTDGVANVDARLEEMKNGQDVAPKELVKNPVGGTVEFFGVEIAPHVEPLPPVEEGGGMGALQQATFLFDTDNATSNAQNCAMVSWSWYDPYGTIFDSLSLEPLSGVTVTIRDGAGVRIPDNPVMRNEGLTLYDGVYNYLVQPGKYTLTFSPPPGYQFSANPKSNPNMRTVYDFIDENNANSHCTIYTPGEIIDEKANTPECRNVPLEPISTNPQIKEPISMGEYEYIPNLPIGIHTIKGKVSHPLAKVIAYQNISPTQRIELATVDANHSGFFTLEIPIKKILLNALIEVEFQKSTLMATTRQVGKNPLILDPLPAYIEGYTMDEAQQIIPNATIQIKLKNGGNIYYETIADKNGYFFIASKDLPSTLLKLEFSLMFITSNGKKIPYKLSGFAQANQYYFTKEGINLLTGKKNGAPAAPQLASKTKLEIVPLSKKQQQTQQEKMKIVQPIPLETSPSQNQSSQQILIVALILLLLGAVGGVVVLLLLKNKQPRI